MWATNLKLSEYVNEIITHLDYFTLFESAEDMKKPESSCKLCLRSLK